MDKIEKHVSCKCSAECLLFTKFINDEDKEIYIAIYTIGQYNPKPSIWERIKYCLYHLKTGKKYEDQIILTYDKAQEVGKWLIENAK